METLHPCMQLEPTLNWRDCQLINTWWHDTWHRTTMYDSRQTIHFTFHVEYSPCCYTEKLTPCWWSAPRVFVPSSPTVLLVTTSYSLCKTKSTLIISLSIPSIFDPFHLSLSSRVLCSILFNVYQYRTEWTLHGLKDLVTWLTRKSIVSSSSWTDSQNCLCTSAVVWSYIQLGPKHCQV